MKTGLLGVLFLSFFVTSQAQSAGFEFATPEWAQRQILEQQQERSRQMEETRNRDETARANQARRGSQDVPFPDAGWVEIGKDPSTGIAGYLHPDAIHKEGDLRRFYAIVNHPKQRTYTRVMHEANCKTNQIRELAWTLYSAPMPRGQLLRGGVSKQDWGGIGPGTLGEHMFKKVCIEPAAKWRNRTNVIQCRVGPYYTTDSVEILQYQGKCVNGVAEGNGTVQFNRTNRSGNKISMTYSGKFHLGQKHGLGKEVWANGMVVGEWRDGEPYNTTSLQRYGRDRYLETIQKDGRSMTAKEISESDFRSAMQSSNISKEDVTKEVVVGCRVEPLYFKRSIEVIQYQGNCVNGVADGKGTVRFIAVGSQAMDRINLTYSGEFHLGKQHGEGKMVWSSEAFTGVTAGEWKEGHYFNTNTYQRRKLGGLTEFYNYTVKNGGTASRREINEGQFRSAMNEGR